MGEQIRCASYSVYLRSRVTGEPVDGCDFSRLDPKLAKFSWLYSVVSLAELILVTGETDCCGCQPIEWEHELVFERFDRAGQSEGDAWVGPVWKVVDDGVNGELQILALDRSVWPMQRRDVIRQPIHMVGADKTDLWMALWKDLEVGGPSGLTPVPRPVGVTGELHRDRFDLLGTAFDDLAEVRWTVVGDRMFGPGPETVPPIVVGTLDVDRHWEQRGAVIESDGEPTATFVIVAGEGDVIGTWPPGGPAADPLVGLHIKRYDDPTVSTAERAEARAREIWVADRDGDRFLVTSDGTLGPSTPFDLWQMIPGSLFEIEAGVSCLQLEERMRVVNVVVELAAIQPGVLSEARVAIDLQPADSDRLSDSRASV